MCSGMGGKWYWNNPPLYYWLVARLIVDMTPMLALTASDCMKTMQAMLTLLFVMTCLRFMRRLGLNGRRLVPYTDDADMVGTRI